MAEPISVAPGVVIPAAAVSFRAVRSSGPGGQNVNKVASRVELRVDLSLVEGLSAPARARLEQATASRRDSEGLLLLTSQRTRDQHRNLEDAREKVRRIVARALVEPRRRRPTRPTAESRRRRVAEKRLVGAVKRRRGRVQPED